MAIRFLKATFKGINPLLLNNPQTVDRFNHYAKAMSKINAKKTKRTDDDYLELRNLEMKAKIYFDSEVGLYVPSTWVLAAVATNSFRTAKISRDSIRGGVFTTEDKLKLKYRGMDKVKTEDDVVFNEMFRHQMLLPQGQVRVAKTVPIFHDWEFECGLEFDDAIADEDSMKTIIKHAAKYGGFGDFRPTFGRATVEIDCE